MPYCQLYYHLVWTTRNRAPLLTPTAEPAILDYLRWRAINCRIFMLPMAITWQASLLTHRRCWPAACLGSSYI